MRTLLTLLALVLVTICFQACTKKNEAVLPTEMRLKIDDDTAFVTTNVITDNKGTGTIYLKGFSPDGTQSLEIALAGYAGKKGTFTVDYRGPGGNITGNTGQYQKGSNITMARSGTIVVTSVSGGVIKGNFAFYYMAIEMRGSFVAAEH